MKHILLQFIQDHNVIFHIKNTVAGTLLTVMGIGFEDVLKTIILATLGATISFFVSLGWKKYFKK